MPKSASQNALIKERRKTQIMETALKLFANYGVDNVTVDNISQAMKISHGLFYHYFEDKEDLVNALIAKAKELFTQNLNEVRKEEKNPSNLIEAITDSILRSVNSTTGNAYYLFLVLSLNYQVDQPGKDFATNLRNYLLQIFEQGKENGEFKDINNKELLALYVATLQGIAYHKIKFKNDYTAPEVESIMALFSK